MIQCRIKRKPGTEMTYRLAGVSMMSQGRSDGVKICVAD
jgi:hypothetical protein